MAEATLINRSIKTVFYYISGIAVVIAAAGLFALVSLTIAQRTKEIGIRKVLGASVLSIGHLINREFLLMLLLASVAASVTGYFTLDLMLDSIWAYHVDLGVLPFLGATLAIFLIAVLTVGGRVYATATSNPIHALRYE
jgi:putative ABC transport system permease protein